MIKGIVIATILGVGSVAAAEPRPLQLPGESDTTRDALKGPAAGPDKAQGALAPAKAAAPNEQKLRELIVNRLVALGHGSAAILTASQILSQLHGADEYALAATLAATAYLGTAVASAIFHHWVDNYGKVTMRFGIGAIVKAFRDHHRGSTLAEDSYSTVTQEAGKLLLPLLAALAYASSDHVGLGPLVSTPLLVLLETTINGQWFHRLSHTPGKRLSRFVRRLQKHEVIVSPRAHALHHLDKPHVIDGRTVQPFATNYDIIGPANKTLEKLNFFRLWEAARYKLSGIEPEVWKDTPAVKSEALGLWRHSPVRRYLGGTIAKVRRARGNSHRPGR